MKLQNIWTEKMRFNTTADQHAIAMDAKSPIGGDTAPTPKQLVLAAICGCAGMDIVGLLKKYRQPLESFVTDAEADMVEGAHPAVFKEVRLRFCLKGAMDSEKVLEAVRLSQTKFCSVSAMISKTAPIHYRVELNEKEIGSGQAQFL